MVTAGGERGIFVELDGGVIVVSFAGREKQQAEGMAGPAIVLEQAIETGFAGAALLVDGVEAERMRAVGVLTE